MIRQEDIVSYLKTFLADLRQAMGTRLAAEGAQRSAYRRIFDNLPADGPGSSTVEPVRQPACRHLEACYSALETAEPDLRNLAASFRALEPRLGWSNEGERRLSPALAENYADAMIVGRGGLLPSGTVEIGISVMAPDTIYPNHRHRPEELYIALSPGSWRQQDGLWHEPGIGGLVYNPTNIVHAMRSGERPLFAIWCLPLS
jgi:Dimethlysulfonioproprionate lyase